MHDDFQQTLRIQYHFSDIILMRSERYETNEKASIEIYGSSVMTVAQLKNISESGACLFWADSRFPLEKGDLIRMTVVLNSLGKQHRINGEVIWIDGMTTGVQFLKPNEVVDKIVAKTALVN